MPARQARRSAASWWCRRGPKSLPYVVLEAAASGKPLITTRVGGIPEIYGPLSDTLVPPDDAAALAARHRRRPRPSGRSRGRRAQGCANALPASFSVETMVDGVLAAYQAALETLQQDRPPLRQFSAVPISLF